MRWKGAAYRGHDPRWSFKPTSGDGAAQQGGRFNPKGTAALYLACSAECALVEATRGLPHRFDPLVLCSYDVDVADLVDLTTDTARLHAGISLPDMKCAWEFELAKGRTPASWDVAKRLMARGAAGILTPSFARGAHADWCNLVLWWWGPDLPHQVLVHDPEGRLPKDQASWRA